MSAFTTGRPQISRRSPSGNFGFVVTIIFFIFEYGRPQDTIPVIGALHPNWILVTLMIGAWLNSPKFSMTKSPQTYRVFLFLLLLAVHVPLAHNNFFAYSVTKGFLLKVIPFISIILFVNTIDRLKVFMKFWFFLMVYLSVKGILGAGVAGSSFLEDENDFALLINAMLPFGICLFFYEQEKPRKLVYLIGSLLAIASIVASFSRGGFIGLIAVFFVIWLKSPRKGRTLVLICVLALTVYLVSDQSYWADMSTIDQTDEGTAKERTDSWQAAWAMFKAHPLGVGPGNFPVWFPEYQPDSMRRSMWGRQAHSLWFTLLPELGVPGVLLYLSLLRVNVRDLRHLRDRPPDTEHQRYFFFLSLAFMASLSGFFASGSFISVLYYPHYWYLTAMIVASKKVILSVNPAKPETTRQRFMRQ